MNSKFYYAALVGALVSFLLGWIVYGMLMMEFYKANTTVYEGLMKDPPVLWAIFIGNLCTATLLSWIYSKMGIKTFMKGATTGLWVGFLLTAWFYAFSHAFMNLYSTKLTIADLVVSSLFTAVIGGLIASILGMGNKPAATT